MLILLIVAGCATKQPVASVDGQAALAAGMLALERGDFEGAARSFEAAAAVDDTRINAEALIQLAAAQQMLGRFDLAVESLDKALLFARALGDPKLKARALNSLGVALTFNPRAMHNAPTPASRPVLYDASGALREALQIAREMNDVRLEGAALTNLGNYDARSGRYAMAEKSYAEAAKIAPDDLSAARARVNSAVALLSAGEGVDEDPVDAAKGVSERVTSALARLDRVADSHEKAFLYLTAGRAVEQAAALDAKSADAQRTLARSAYAKALAIAEKTGDLRSRSYACGYLGGLELAAGRRKEAEEYTQRAILAAQQIRSPDALYRWQWQNARILKSKWKESKADADLASSAAFYDGAVQTVKFIRNDISLGYGNQRKQLTFRENIGSLYFEYADVLLERSGGSDVNANELYKQARGAIEQLKAVELENYFQDECVSLIKRKKKELEDLDEKTAVVYMIPLEDRVEILVSFGKGDFFRAKNDGTNRAKLEKLSKQFREEVSGVATTVIAFDEYRRTGRALYDALIKPIHHKLTGIETLVFVPDGPLRTIPMAALVDEDKKHLVETFAIGISPGLELLESGPKPEGQAELLATGLSIQLEGEQYKKFPALTRVPEELNNVQALYPRSTRLLDEQFKAAAMKQELDARTYSIVHVATHAQFGASARDSFLLTSEGKMPLDEVERLIRPYQLRNQPVELLTLSACQTAEGDQERAALGLAGIAVKAGARSAMATLWSVNEQASVELVRLFYQELSKPNVSKAQALRKAQEQLIKGKLDSTNPEFRLPYYWAPFVVIGNWR
jgi:CHAT domain-containing protein